MVGPFSKQLPLKLLCSYGGKILPRHSDGKLRYYGGDTRVLSVDPSISFSELMVKLREMCGSIVNLRCQLPTEDLDSLVSITCDEDLANLIEEYDRAATPSSSLKIRAFLSPPKSTKKIASPASSITSSSSSTNTNHDATSLNSFCSTAATPLSTATSSRSHNCPRPSKKTTTANYSVDQLNRCTRQTRPAMMSPVCHHDKFAGKLPQYAYNGQNNGHVYLIHHGNHWQ